MRGTGVSTSFCRFVGISRLAGASESALLATLSVAEDAPWFFSDFEMEKLLSDFEPLVVTFAAGLGELPVALPAFLGTPFASSAKVFWWDFLEGGSSLLVVKADFLFFLVTPGSALVLGGGGRLEGFETIRVLSVLAFAIIAAEEGAR